MSRVSVVVFSPANLNAIDGSSIWTQSVTFALAGIPNVDASILLSHPIVNDRIVGPLLAHPGVSVIDPWETKKSRRFWRRGLGAPRSPLSLDEAARLLATMSHPGPQAFVVRGASAARRLAAESALRGKLLPYLTDIPQRLDDLSESAVALIDDVMDVSPALLCQTEELRDFLEANLPSVAGKAWVLPPTVPDDLTVMTKLPPTPERLALAYSGKFARMWNTFEMCDLPSRLSERGITATLTMVGDKINRDPDYPEFVAAMRQRLQNAPGVNWVGGVSRASSIELVGNAHVGLSWRSHELDDSLELSTKLLEYCAVGTPPLLNRTLMHERIFGSEYPLFVDSEVDVLDKLEAIARDESLYSSAVSSIGDIAGTFSLSRATESLATLIEKLYPGSVDGNQP